MMSYPSEAFRSGLYSTLIIAGPLENRFCPDCTEPWDECVCPVPTYEQVAENPSLYREGAK
jgi:hypothetical protein